AVGNLDPVAPARLRNIERLVRLRHQRLDVDIVFLGGHRCDTHADAHISRRYALAGIDRLEADPDPFGCRYRTRRLRSEQHGPEFLATDPADQIGGTQFGHGNVREGAQHPVADGVSETVIDRLELIEIEQQRRYRL